MKRMFFSLGLSVTILLSAAFAQETMQKATAPVAKSTVEFTSMQQRPLTRKPAVKRINSNTPVAKGDFQLVACYKSKANLDKVVVKLINGMNWGDGSGYHVLLDNKHVICDSLNENGQISDQETVGDIYALATTIIPTGAQPSVESVAIKYGQIDSAIIDPGTYDMMITNPSPYEGETLVYVADGGDFDDFEFEAGTTYVFNVIRGGSGDYVRILPDWNITLEGLVWPTINCQTTEVPVTMSVTNYGKENINTFKATYCVVDYFEGDTVGDVVEETFTTNLATGVAKEFTFTKKIAFAADDDVIYAVFAEILPLEGEEENEDEDLTEDNSAEDLLVRKTSVEVPHTFQLDSFDLTFNINVWDIDEDDDDIVLSSSMPNYPAITRCINMEVGTYRIDYDRMVGTIVWIFADPASYRVLFGKANTDISTWNSIYSEKDTLYEDFVKHTLLVDVTEAGEYAFAFVQDTSSGNGGLYIKNIVVGEVLDKDVKLNAFYGMPSMMPIEHVNRTYVANYEAVNWGSENVDKATLKITLNNQEVASKEIALGKIGEVKTGTIDIPVTGLTSIADAVFTATLDFAGDEDLQNNAISRTMKVTDNIMAYDYVTEDMYSEDGIGNSFTFGVPFSINQKDTLTGVVVGFGNAEEGRSVGILIHQWDPEKMTLGNRLYGTIDRKSVDAEASTYTIPALLLEPGNYMISVYQIGEEFLNLLVDHTKEGVFHLVEEDLVSAIPGLGTPMIRAMFGHDGKPFGKDLAVEEISKPVKDLGVFSNEEPIVVKVRNNGYEAVEGSLTVMVNKEELTAQTVKLAAYAETEYTFKGDLSAANTDFVLTATATLEGDENVENNTVTRTVKSMPPLDPYKMDFEYCDDFAIDNELAVWKGVCGPSKDDADGTFGFQGISFPHSNELFAFIAYNAASTTPASSGYIEAHGGERFGASFAWRYTDMENYRYVGVPNDAWLISPQLKLANENANIKFFVKTYDGEIGLEEYNVLISTTDNKLESFEKLGETRKAPAEDWTEVTVDLADYNGKTAYLAIQCVSDDQFIFMIDDIVVAGNVANDNNVASIRLNAWPNPASEMVYISADQAIEQVCIYTPAGNLLYQSANNMNAEEFRYNVKNLNSGLYIARVKTAQGVAVVKFVVR